MAVLPVAWRGPLIVAGCAAAIAASMERPVMPPFVPFGNHAAYDALTPRAVALVEPVAHAPWFGAAPAAMAAILAAAVLAVLWVAARRAGATAAAAVVVVAAAISRPDFRLPLALGAEPMVGLGLGWAAALVFTAGLPPARSAAWGGALTALAVAVWPPLVVVTPMVAAALAAGSLASAATIVGAIAGGIAGLGLWAARAAALGQEPVSLAEVLSFVTAVDPRGTDPFVWLRPASVALPATLAMVGAVALLRQVTTARRIALAVAVLTPLVADWAAPIWRDEIRRAVLGSAWPLVGGGICWLAAWAPRDRAPWVTAGIGSLLVAGGLSASVRQVEDDDRRAFATALAGALAPIVAAGPATVVAEDTRVDTALVAWGAGLGLQRVRLLPPRVDAAVASGRTVLAGPMARYQLELWGFRLATRAGVASPAPFNVAAITGRLQCLPVASPWRELPGLEYSGRLGLHVPAGVGRLDVVILSPPPLSPRMVRMDGQPTGLMSPLPMDLPSLPPVLWPGDGRLPDGTLNGVRLELAGRTDTAQSVALSLGWRAPQVAARFVDDARSSDVATVCAASLPRDAFEGDAALPLDDNAYFTGGWHVAERDASGWFRWTAGRAVTLVPAASSAAVTVVVTARPAVGAARPVTLSTTVNGWTAGARAMSGGPADYRWTVPASVWVDGTNEIVFDVSATARPSDAGAADTRELGVAVTSLRIVRE